MIHVRTLREDEPMPTHLGTGFEQMDVEKRFCWIAENGGEKAIGILMAAPYHGAMFLGRVCVEPGAPTVVATLLLRHFVRDSKAQGYKGYFTFVNPEGEVEQRLISICIRAKGIRFPERHVPIAGRFEEAGEF